MEADAFSQFFKQLTKPNRAYSEGLMSYSEDRTAKRNDYEIFKRSLRS